jgi:hypothetical protein
MTSADCSSPGSIGTFREEEWIEEFREAIVNWNPPVRRHFLRPVLAAATFAALCCSVLYVQQRALKVEEPASPKEDGQSLSSNIKSSRVMAE